MNFLFGRARCEAVGTLFELGVWNAELGISFIPYASFATPNSNVSVHIVETPTGRFSSFISRSMSLI